MSNIKKNSTNCRGKKAYKDWNQPKQNPLSGVNPKYTQQDFPNNGVVKWGV